MISILPLIDGHCRTMRAVLLGVKVGSQRMRLASSAWKDSSFCNRVGFKIHVSAPNSRHGNTTVFDDTLGGKGVESTVEDSAASCKEGASRLLDVFFNPLSAR